MNDWTDEVLDDEEPMHDQSEWDQIDVDSKPSTKKAIPEGQHDVRINKVSFHKGTTNPTTKEAYPAYYEVELYYPEFNWREWDRMRVIPGSMWKIKKFFKMIDDERSKDVNEIPNLMKEATGLVATINRTLAANPKNPDKPWVNINYIDIA